MHIVETSMAVFNVALYMVHTEFLTQRSRTFQGFSRPSHEIQGQTRDIHISRFVHLFEDDPLNV